MKNTKTRNMVITALLTALTILIPQLPLRVIIPPAFTATLTLHVPIFIAMFISPWSAAFVAIGSAFGFVLTGLPPTVAARASTHVVFAVVGAYMLRSKRGNIWFKLALVWFVTMILHAAMEAIIVIPAMRLFTNTENYAIYSAAYVTGIGTLIHHTIDYIITIPIVVALSRAKLIDLKI